MLRITCKSGHEPEGVMNRFYQVNSLVVRRFAPNNRRMKSAFYLVGVLKLFLNQRPLLQYLPKMPELAFLVNSKLSGGFTATWKTVSSHNKSLFIRFANLGTFDK